MIVKRSLFLLALVATLISAGNLAIAESSYYADTVAASNPLVYLRLNEAAGVPDLGTVANTGTNTTITATLGITSSYTGRNATSGAVGVTGDDFFGLEEDNLACDFAPTSSPNYSKVIQLVSPADDKLALDLANVTYALWIKSPGAVKVNTRLFSTPNDGSGNYVPAGYDFTNDFWLSVDTSGGSVSLVTDYQTVVPVTPNVATGTLASDLFDNEWHFIVATRNGDDATNAKLYIDGQEIMLTASSATTRETYAHRFGAWGSSYSSGHPFQGQMDEIAIWGSTLTSTDVTTLYTAAQVPEPGTIALLITALVGGLLVWRRK